MWHRTTPGFKGHPSLHQLPAALLVLPLRNLENEIRPVSRQLTHEQAPALHTADLGHGALRAPVLVPDPEDDGVDEGESVVEHQPLDRAFGAAAPRAAGQKRPADLDLAQFRLMAMVAAGA